MKANIDNDNLVKRCLNGERSAQYELYHLYSKAMFNVALRMMVDRVEAEDMLQMSFVRVFQNLTRYRGDSTLGAWIKRIVINQCLTELRKRKVFFEDISEKEVVIVEDSRNERDVNYEVEKIKTAMNLLSDGYRTIFSLYLLEGYDHNEISEMLNISESTSKSQLSRAKKKVKELVYALSS